ncbi:MAG: PQQ-binding-like beta-propeller repeat protein, partial [Gemmataceae bacterium]
GDERGVVRALDNATGKLRWTAYTSGAMKYPPALWNSRVYVGGGDGYVHCLQAADGKPLWRFRAAPAERRLPVFGSLLSTWPVGSGVLVDQGVVFAAAGMHNYDGTHVYALDAITGKIRWQNNSSGHLFETEHDTSGVGVQSHLLLHEGSLYLSGGPEVPMAAYDLKTGACRRKGAGRGKDLFLVKGQVIGTGPPLYWRPDDWHFIEAGTLQTVNGFVGVALNTQEIALAADSKEAKPLIIWKAKPFSDVSAIAVGKNALVVAGVERVEQGEDVKSSASLLAMNLADGKVLWKQPLPAAAVNFGVAFDRDGRIFVSLRDGRVVCFGGK